MKSSRFLMPGEWYRHTRTWMAWPYRKDNWKLDAIPAQHAYLSVAWAIAEFEPVSMCVPSNLMSIARQSFEKFCSEQQDRERMGRIAFVAIDSDDAWVRDTGPTFVFDQDRSGALVGVDWKFNAWGGVYSPCDRDAALASKVLASLGIERIEADFVLEGGSIHVDGEGTILTTEECLLNANRNPHLSKQEIEDRLKAYLGGEKVIWLPHGLVNDEDTNGHIDNICCFTKPGEVVLAWTDDESDPQHAISQHALQLLQSSTDACGRPLRVVKLPIPSPMHYGQEDLASLESNDGDQMRSLGSRLAGSYVNFYICNGGIICPQFGDPVGDRVAMEILAGCFPEHQVRGVQTKDILLGGGNIHCITQQEPAP